MPRVYRLLLALILIGATLLPAIAAEPTLDLGGGLDTHQQFWAPPVWTQPAPADAGLVQLASSTPDPATLAAAAPASGAPAAGVPQAPPPEPVEPILNSDYWLGYFTDIPRFFTAPLRFDTTDWIKTGAFVIAAGGAYLGDEHVRRFFRDHRTSTGDSIAAFGYRLGDSKTILGGVAVAYAAGYAADDHTTRETALLVLQSWAFAQGATEGVKYLAGRQRPGYTDDKSQVEGPGSAGKSFFSGHAANAFAVAAVVSEQYDEPWVAPLAYSLAGLVAWSRLNDNAHWGSDVVVGAGVGYAIGKLVTHFSPFRDQPDMTAAPLLAPGGGGVQLGFRF